MSRLPSDLIYRLMPPSLWDGAKASGHLLYAPVDDADGYFHLSAPDQVLETARRHYADHSVLIGCGVHPERLGDDLKWEPSRGGALFPHYYGYLATDHVTCLIHLDRQPDATFAVRRVEALA